MTQYADVIRTTFALSAELYCTQASITVMPGNVEHRASRMRKIWI